MGLGGRKFSITRAEQETIIRWDEEEKVVHLYSASPVTWRKMERLGIQPNKITTRQGVPTGKFYTWPLQAFRWGKKREGVPGQGGRPFPPRKPRILAGGATVESGFQEGGKGA